MTNYDVPFFNNTDNTHCYQTCLKMILKYFETNKDYSFEKLDKITDKTPDMPTWPMAGLCWLIDRGYDVVEIEQFDYSRFLKEGKKYITEVFGTDVASYGNKNMNDKLAHWTKEFIKKCQPQNRDPIISDYIDLLDKGYLICAHVNWRKMHNKAGYAGHKILVKGYDELGFFVHDPGLPGQENLHVSFKDFDIYVSEAKELTAIRLSYKYRK